MFDNIPLLNWFTPKFYMNMITLSFVLYLMNLLYLYQRRSALRNQDYLNKKKIILITGGCMGIGREMIKILVNRFNCKILNLDIREDLFESLAEESKDKDNYIENFKCDLANLDEISKVVEEIFQKYPKINILINNAAIAFNDYFNVLTEKQLVKTIEINLNAPMVLSKKFLHQIENLNDDEFHIVNIGSNLSHISTRKSVPYIASKWGLFGMHDAIRYDYYEKRNIHFTVVCPFVINTGMFPGYKNYIPFLQILNPEEVAERVIEGIILKEYEIYLPNITKYLIMLCKVLPVMIRDKIYFSLFDNSLLSLGSRND